MVIQKNNQIIQGEFLVGELRLSSYLFLVGFVKEDKIDQFSLKK